MKLIRVGVDLAKNVFQVHGVDRTFKSISTRGTEPTSIRRGTDHARYIIQ